MRRAIDLCVIPWHKRWAVKKDSCKRPIVTCQYKYQAIHIAEELTICNRMPTSVKIGLEERLFNKAKIHYYVNYKRGKIVRIGVHKFIMKIVPVFAAPLRVRMDYQGIAKKLLEPNMENLGVKKFPVYDKDLPKTDKQRRKQ